MKTWKEPTITTDGVHGPVANLTMEGLRGLRVLPRPRIWVAPRHQAALRALFEHLDATKPSFSPEADRVSLFGGIDILLLEPGGGVPRKGDWIFDGVRFMEMKVSL